MALIMIDHAQDIWVWLEQPLFKGGGLLTPLVAGMGLMGFLVGQGLKGLIQELSSQLRTVTEGQNKLPLGAFTVQSLTAIGFSGMAIQWGLHAPLLWWSVFMAMLILLAFIDAHTQFLPDRLTLPLMWMGLLGSAFGVLPSPSQAILGAALGYGLLWGLYQIYKACTGVEGMGYGDFKLLAALGAWLGVYVLPSLLLVAGVAGLLGWAWQRGLKRKTTARMPFGPYLALAALVHVWGPSLYSVIRYKTYQF